MLAAGAQIPSIVEKNMLKKKLFFHKTRSVGASWAPASQGPSLVATFYADSGASIIFSKFAHIRII